MSRLTDINLQYLPELSVRHLPDISDASFEMPQADDDYLLAKDGDDFLKTADISLTTPPRTRTLRETMTISQLTPGPPGPSLLHEPLTLSDLTPKPKTRTAASSPRLPPFALPALNPESRSKFNEIVKNAVKPVGKALRSKLQVPAVRQADGTLSSASRKGGVSPVPQDSQRYEHLKMEVESPAKNTEKLVQTGPSTSRAPSRTSKAGFNINPRLRIRDKGKPRSKGTVAAGGIIKPGKSKLPSSTLVRTAKARATCRSPDRPPGNDLTGLSCNDIMGDVSMSLTGGVAKRLVDYGQKLMDSFGQLNTESEKLPDIRGRGGSNTSLLPPEKPISSSVPCNDDPLTLSQISPRRVATPAKDPDLAPVPSPPTQHSRKRPIVDDGLGEQHKRRKPDVPTLSSVPTALQPTVKNVLSHTSKATLVKTKAALRHEQTLKSKGKEDVTSSGSSNSSTTQPKPNDRSVGRRAFTNQTRSAAGILPVAEKPVRSTNPTKPVGFNFALDARKENRKAEAEEKQMTLRHRRHAKPVPDFKALHAAEEALSVCRKEHIMPVLPIAHQEFNTDIRAREREKFDEMVKEKELEIEKRMEERRRQKEMEEEREIRELRRKAVPRANEVPEWYASLTKKSGSSQG